MTPPEATPPTPASAGRAFPTGADSAEARLVLLSLLEDQRRAEVDLKRANRALRMLSDCNHRVVRATDEPRLLREICQIVVEAGAYELAWVGYALDDPAKSVQPVAWFGQRSGQLEELRVTWADNERGQGPTGTAIRTAQPCVIRDLRNDPRLAPWQDQVRRVGHAAMCSLPLRDGPRAFGALIIYDTRAGGFTEDEVALLQELADNLAFGIGALRARQARAVAEQALREREHTLKHALSIARLGTWTADPVAGTFDATPEGAALVGWEPGLHRLEALLEVIHPEDRPRMQAAWQAALEGAPYDIEHRIVLDGRVRWLHARAEIQFDAEGHPVRATGITQDITERRRAELALAEETIRRRILIEQSRDGIVVLDDQGKVYEANHRYAEMLGYSAAEVRELHVWDWDGLWTKEQLLEMVRNVGPEGDHLETRHRRKDGSWFDVDISTNAAICNGRKLIFCVCRDISQRKRDEEALRCTLKEKEVLLKEVHHRVKNNLQLMSSLLHLQEAQLDSPAARSLLQDTQARIRSMALLHEALYRSGDLARVSLGKYLEGLVAYLGRALRVPDCLQIHLRTEDVYLDLDLAVPCGLIVNEWMTNSLKHAFPNGRAGEITVELLAPKPGRVRVRVADNGVGLPPGFDPDRVASLGLQLVKDLAQQCGGTVSLDRQGGTSLTLDFPERPES